MHRPKRQTHIKALLDKLFHAPPQALVLEGGSVDERISMAEYWAMGLNCTAPHIPCGNCMPCIQIAGNTFWDVRIFDGRKGSIKIDEVRELRPLLAEPPRGKGYRVILFYEAQEMTRQAANALLKSLEEPVEKTVFVLLVPQRQWLLPTLVSRSWVLTLAWPQPEELSPELSQWLQNLVIFLRSGKGWFQHTGIRGAVDKHLAMEIILACQKEYISALADGEQGLAPASELGQGFAKMDMSVLKKIDLLLNHAKDALTLPTPVNPALVLDWLATSMHRTLRSP